jgi:hypothetical protein
VPRVPRATPRSSACSRMQVFAPATHWGCSGATSVPRRSGLGQRLGPSGLEFGELSPLALRLSECGLQPCFEGSGDKAVLGLA